MLLWEIENEKVPFEGVSPSEVTDMICAQKLRPSILESCDYSLAYMIRKCWTSHSSKRPSFSDIARDLKQCKFSGQGNAPGTFL